MQTMSILDNLSKTFNEDQAKSISRALEEYEAEKQHITMDKLTASLRETEIRRIKWIRGLMIAKTTIKIAILKMIG